MGTETGAKEMEAAQGMNKWCKGPENGARDQKMVRGTRKWCNKPERCTKYIFGPSIVYNTNFPSFCFYVNMQIHA